MKSFPKAFIILISIISINNFALKAQDQVNQTHTQTIHIPQGLSYISFNTIPENGQLNVCDVFAEIINDIDYISDDSGSLVYWSGLCIQDLNFSENGASYSTDTPDNNCE